MDSGFPSMSHAFYALPIELNQRIVYYLTDHKDIANFSLICTATRDAINGDNYSVWRLKFREEFAMLPEKSNSQLRRRYQYRWGWIHRFISRKVPFVHGTTRAEKAILNVLRGLIVESFANSIQLSHDDRPQCPNMTHLQTFVLRSRIMLGGKRPPNSNVREPINNSLAAIRLMLSHFLLDQTTPPGSWFAIDDAQKAVYAATNVAPIYLGPSKDVVNLEWVFQCMNFFRYHMTTPELSLHAALEDLDKTQRPSAWSEPLKSGTHPLVSHWKGTYAFLEHDDLVKFRKYARFKQEGEDKVFIDLNVEEGKIQSIKFDFLAEGAVLPWPRIFEERLHSRRNIGASHGPPQHSKKTFENYNADIRFDGSGEDLHDDFFATGWLNALPPQCEIPGWQRITFMKHFEDDFNTVSRDNLWAYEGVVLPGGRIILGRWWYASDENVDFDNEYGGPFILWAVDDEADKY